MKKLLILLTIFASNCWSQPIIYGERCMPSTSGSLFEATVACPKPGGSIAKDSIGRLVCGLGRCERDGLGRVICSVRPGGQVGKDIIGNIKCMGGCEEAKWENCETMK